MGQTLAAWLKAGYAAFSHTCARMRNWIEHSAVIHTTYERMEKFCLMYLAVKLITAYMALRES